MKNQFAVLFASILCSSSQLFAQETPKLEAFSYSQKAKENNLEVKTSEPVMAIWAQDPVTHPKNNQVKAIPELALEKIEKKESISEEK